MEEDNIVKINIDKCDGCDLCAQVCPTLAFKFS